MTETIAGALTIHKLMYFLKRKTIPMFVFSQNLISSLQKPKMEQKKFSSHFSDFNLKNNILNANSDILDSDQSKVQNKTFPLVTVKSSFHSFKDKIGEFKDEKSSKATLVKRFICAKYRTAKNYYKYLTNEFSKVCQLPAKRKLPN